jgi:outer membrane protein assembly factor BamB
MTEYSQFERRLATFMREEASGQPPAHLALDVLDATSRVRPDPRWLAVLKEPSMHTQTRLTVGLPARRLILLLALLALFVAVIAAVAVGAALLRPTPPALGDDWPMFRGDSTRSGTAVRGPVGNPVVKWKFHAQGAVAQNLAIVGDLVYVPTDTGFVDAIGVSDGSLRWSVQLDHGPASGLIVTNGLVLVRDGGGVAHGLDAASGQERWRSSGSSPGSSNAALGDGAMYVGSENGDLVAFDIASGLERWRTNLGNGGPVNSSAFADGLVYTATAQAGYYAVDAQSGRVRWKYDTGAETTGTPVVVDGIAYIGAGTDSLNAHLRALNARTGQLLWQRDEPDGSPTVLGNVGYSNGPVTTQVLALDVNTGRQLWRVDFPGGGTTRAPAIADGILYVPQDGEHRIYALDAATGGERWHFDLDSGNQCCIAVAKGSVFVGTAFGTVYSISGDGSTLTPAPIATEPQLASAQPTAGQTSRASTQPSQASGLLPPAPTEPTQGGSSQPATTTAAEPAEFVWRARGPEEGLIPSPGLAFDAQGRIWVPDTANNRFAIFRRDGTFVDYWGKGGVGNGEFDLRRANGDGYGSIAFAADGSFYVLDVGNRRVQKFDAQRRFAKAWGRFGSDPGQYADPVGIAVRPDGRVLVLDDARNVVESYDANGHVLESFNPFLFPGAGTNGSNALSVDAAGNVYVSEIEPNQVAKFDSSGKWLGSFGSTGPGAFTEQAGSIAIDKAGRVFVTQGPVRGPAPGVLVFGPDGVYLGGFGLPGSRDGHLAFPTGILLGGDGSLFVVDAGTSDGAAEDGSLEMFRLRPPLTT